MSRRKSARLQVVDRFRPRTDRRFLHRVVENALAFVDRPELEVSLLLTGDADIAELHGRFLGDAMPTDVISFPMDDGVDVVVNVQRARREARRRGTTIRAELALYLVHGILHACAYDDRTSRERARMRAAERAVMDRLALRYAPVDS